MRRRLVMVVAGLAGVVLGAASCGGGSSGTPAASTATTPGSAPTQIAGLDQTWAKVAHQGDLSEIAVGHLAQDRGATRQVRTMGKVLTTDHTRLDRALMKTAGAVTVTMPTQASATQRSAAKKLARKHGKDFDRAFVTGQITAHRETIVLTQREAAKGRSGKLRAAAHAALPVLRKHLDRLEHIQGS